MEMLNNAPVSEYNQPMAPRPKTWAEPWFDEEPEIAPELLAILREALAEVQA